MHKRDISCIRATQAQGLECGSPCLCKSQAWPQAPVTQCWGERLGKDCCGLLTSLLTNEPRCRFTQRPYSPGDQGEGESVVCPMSSIGIHHTHTQVHRPVNPTTHIQSLILKKVILTPYRLPQPSKTKYIFKSITKEKINWITEFVSFH